MSETSRRVLDSVLAYSSAAETLAREVEALEVERDAALAKLAEAERERDEADAALDALCESIGGASNPEQALGKVRRLGEDVEALRARLALAENVCEAADAGLLVLSSIGGPSPTDFLAALDAWRAAKGGDAGASRDDATQVAAPADSTSAKGAPLRGGLGYNPDGPRCSVCTMPKCRCQHSGEPEHAEHCRCAPGLVVHERVPTTTGGLISSMPAGKPASPLPGGLGPSYTRAEVDAAIAQAKREVVEMVAEAVRDSDMETTEESWIAVFEMALRKAASRG
jgi:hypothetical protein